RLILRRKQRQQWDNDPEPHEVREDDEEDSRQRPLRRLCRYFDFGHGLGVIALLSAQSTSTAPALFPLPLYSGGGLGWGFSRACKNLWPCPGLPTGAAIIFCGTRPFPPPPCTQGEGWGGGSSELAKIVGHARANLSRQASPAKRTGL